MAWSEWKKFSGGLTLKEVKTLTLSNVLTEVNLGYKPQFLVFIMSYGGSANVHTVNFNDNSGTRYQESGSKWNTTSSEFIACEQTETGFKIQTGYSVANLTWYCMAYE